MSRTDKILNSLGNIRDDFIEETYNYKPDIGKEGINAMTNMRKIVISVFAVVLSLSLVVTAFAYGDEISLRLKEILRREEQMIDPYARVIDESTVKEDITFTVDKVAQGSDFYIYYTIKNNSGVFDKGLTFDRIYIKNSDFDYNIGWTVGSMGVEERGDDPNSSIALVNYGLDDPCDTISSMIKMSAPVGKYTLAIENLRSYDGEILYADELEFDVMIDPIGMTDEEIVNSGYTKEEIENMSPEYDYMQSVEYEKIEINTPITIEGCDFYVSHAILYPFEMQIQIEEYRTQKVNIHDHDFYPCAYIDGFTTGKTCEMVDLSHEDNKQMSSMTTEEFLEYWENYNYEESLTAKMFEVQFASSEELKLYNDELEALVYKPYITMKDGSVSDVISIEANAGVQGHFEEDGSYSSCNSVGIMVSFNAPTVKEDIAEVYFLRESDNSKVTVWKP